MHDKEGVCIVCMGHLRPDSRKDEAVTGIRTDLMQRGRFSCHSEHCGGREFTAIPGLESTCPNCGSSEVELLDWLDDGRLAHLTVCGSVSVEVPENGIPESDRLAFRKRARRDIDKIVAILSHAKTHRYDRADGAQGGYFPTSAMAVAELI